MKNILIVSALMLISTTAYAEIRTHTGGTMVMGQSQAPQINRQAPQGQNLSKGTQRLRSLRGGLTNKLDFTPKKAEEAIDETLYQGDENKLLENLPPLGRVFFFTEQGKAIDLTVHATIDTFHHMEGLEAIALTKELSKAEEQAILTQKPDFSDFQSNAPTNPMAIQMLISQLKGYGNYADAGGKVANQLGIKSYPSAAYIAVDKTITIYSLPKDMDRLRQRIIQAEKQQGSSANQAKPYYK